MSVWLTARGAGLAALILLTISVSLGALVSDRGNAARRFVLQYVHRVAGVFGLAALVLHISMILADPWAKVSLTAALIPFTSQFRPTWVGLGTIAVYGFVGVTLIGLARGRMAASPALAKVWRSIHVLAYAGWGAAMLHGIRSGTDTSVPWVRGLYLACGAAVIGSIAMRATALGRPRAAALTRPGTTQARSLNSDRELQGASR
jgi:hypothetical protein